MYSVTVHSFVHSFGYSFMTDEVPRETIHSFIHSLYMPHTGLGMGHTRYKRSPLSLHGCPHKAPSRTVISYWILTWEGSPEHLHLTAKEPKARRRQATSPGHTAASAQLMRLQAQGSSQCTRIEQTLPPLLTPLLGAVCLRRC